MERGPSVQASKEAKTNGKNKKETEEEKMQRVNAEFAAALLGRVASREELGSLRDIYQQNDEELQIYEYELSTNRPSVKTMFMSELLVGNQDSAIDFYEDTIEQVDNFPEDMKPDAIVLSGFLQGDFKSVQKTRRDTLVPELNSMDQQFYYARQTIEKAQATGIPVVYNMSNDDLRIAEEYTDEMFARMEGYAKKAQGMSWKKIDNLRHHPEWNNHKNFQFQEVFPYCLSMGRRLYSAEEMYEMTDGKINMEEYFVLFDAHERAKEGTPLRKHHRAWLRQNEQLRNKDLTIAENLDMHVTTEGKEYHDEIRHNIQHTDTTMYKDPLQTAVKGIENRESNGEETPDMVVTQHQLESVMVGRPGNTYVASEPGMLHTEKYWKRPASRTNASGDPSKRVNTTRKRISYPGATMYERTDDGRMVMTIFDKHLQEVTESIPERMTLAMHSDVQTGSITSRHDMLIKSMDYARQIQLGKNAVAWIWAGDHVQGRNYPHFASESQLTGLMSMDTQERFFNDVVETALNDLTFEELQAIDRWVTQIGNHEYNSGTTKWHGYSFNTSLRMLAEKEFGMTYAMQYAQEGHNPKDIKKMVADKLKMLVKSHEAYKTPDGEYVTGYADVEFFGESDDDSENLGVLIQHSHLHRGGKGGGGLPVYHGAEIAGALGKLMKNVDWLVEAHYHNPQIGKFGKKMSQVLGSFAGLSDYEMKRGYVPVIAGNFVHVGGGLPPQVELLSKEYLAGHEIKHGGYAKEVLEEEGYRDDPGYNPRDPRQGIYIPGNESNSPKSAEQKKLLDMHEDARYRVGRITEFK